MKRQGGSSKRETFWRIVCDMDTFLPLLLVSFTVIGLLSLFALLYVEPGTGAYVILQVDIVLNVTGFATIAFLIYRCGQRRRRDH